VLLLQSLFHLLQFLAHLCHLTNLFFLGFWQRLTGWPLLPPCLYIFLMLSLKRWWHFEHAFYVLLTSLNPHRKPFNLLL
jgi:hypothetical protein